MATDRVDPVPAEARTEATQPLPAALRIEELAVERPDGKRLFQASFQLGRGRIAALMGPSGAGKTSLLRALFDRPSLEEAGFRVSSRTLERNGQVAIVPQGGAAFDHLDVHGNIALVLRNRRPRRQPRGRGVVEWLERVDLPADLARPGAKVGTLSGGMVQRLCLARALAAGRELLVLDEPSTGLDLARIDELGRELRKQARDAAVAVLLVTHDSYLAALAADDVYLVGVTEAGFEQLDLPPVDLADPGPRRAALEVALRTREAPVQPPVRRRSRREASLVTWAGWVLGGLRQPLISLAGIATSLAAPVRDRIEVLRHAYAIALGAPAAFYLVVSILLGYTILYVITSSAPQGVAPSTALRLLGGTYILALTPPLSSLLFVASSGATVNAWLATMGLTGQVEALRSLGIAPRRYLWGPVFESLAISYLLVCLIFAGGLLAGGLLLGHSVGLGDGFAVLSEDLFYPRPERVRLRARAICLVVIYAFGIASEVVWRASRRMRESREVPRAMTTSVILVTLWVVAWELLTAMWMFDMPSQPQLTP